MLNYMIMRIDIKRNRPIVNIILVALFVTGSNRAMSQTGVIYFFDKSASVSFVTNDANCKNILGKSTSVCSGGNAVLTSFYIHSHTASAKHSNQFKLDGFSCLTCKSTTTRNNAQKAHRIKIRKQLLSIEAVLYKDLMAKNGFGTQKGTDIWGIFEVISRTFNGSKGTKHVYLFSDMVHDVSGVKTSPQYKAQAIAEAKAHAKIIRANYFINDIALRGTKVVITLPDNAMRTTHNRNLNYYWEELFREFGMEMM